MTVLRPRSVFAVCIFLSTLWLGSWAAGWASIQPGPAPAGSSLAQGQLDGYLKQARVELDRGRYAKAHGAIYQVLERDHNSRGGWQLLARYAALTQDADLQLWALYRDFRLAEAQGIKTAERKELLERIGEVDPTGANLFELTVRFSEDLLELARRYEKEGRPHGAIRVYKRLLSLDPENQVATEAIERIAAAPDPSLAPHATPRDLFEGVDQAFIDKFDAEHSDWENAAREEREHYITITDTGYKNLIRTAEAMEQVNTFYRSFFRYGGADDGRTVPRITVHLFKNKEEYLEEGFNPVEWSAGHFTGSHVETYLPETGFEGVVGTLFHEAAHQFVSLATSATGWLNEGLASFFEGTRIQANGTVVMNLPAGHRLFPLARRMEKGWMTGPTDGIDPNDSTSQPEKAPTFSIIVENEYAWGPPWYAPTWGLVYFLYNFQDPWDGRFVYRQAFQEFINSSGGRIGKGAIQNFEKVVLGNPSKPITKERPSDQPPLALPTGVGELDAVWKEWILTLRDRQAGKVEESLPYVRWARFAQEAGMGEEAKEHYERALLENGSDTAALDGLADVLIEHFDEEDRASVLLEQLLRVMESNPEADPLELAKLERRIKKLDPDRRNLTRIEVSLLKEAETALLEYRSHARPRMVMEWSRRLARDFGEPRFFDLYGEAVRKHGFTVDLWERAYNEQDLEGWLYGTNTFKPSSELLLAKFGTFAEDKYDYRFLTLDRLTSGDFSLETDVEVRRGKGAFAGIVFGQKGTKDFHGAALFPGSGKAGTVDTGYLDLFSSFGGTIKVWRHSPVKLEPTSGGSVASVWHKLRLDVTGTEVDVWIDGERKMTHSFAGREVLMGSFGLLVGPGQARFRNVRYLSLDPRDPAGVVARKARLAAAGVGSGQPVGGSYQGLPAPFPEVYSWVQGERTSWAEAGPVPQLLVLFTQHQNELMPLHGWLTDLAKRHEAVGLRIVCVAQSFDRSKLPAYLDEHAFPGAVAVDATTETQGGLGLTFDRYFIEQFNLPRLILVDPAGTVVWEGDPGFKAGQAPEAPFATYLDDPLEALIADNQLLERKTWREAWVEESGKALAAGQVAPVLELMQEAAKWDIPFSPEEKRAQVILKRMQAVVADPTSAIAWLDAEGGYAAASVVQEWMDLLEVTLDRKQKRDLGKLRNHKDSKRFTSLTKAMKGYLSKPQGLDAKYPAWAKKMGELDMPFVVTGMLGIESVQASGDRAAFEEALAGIDEWAAAWAVRELLLP